MDGAGDRRTTGTGHRHRLRERFRAVGRRGLAEHELLELLLTYAVPRRDTKPIAKALLRSFGSIAAVLDQPAEKLEAVSGIGPDSSALVTLVRACVERYFEHGRDKGQADRREPVTKCDLTE